MTKSERARLARLERENAELREKIAQHMRVYGDLLCEVCDLKARLAAVSDAITDNDDEKER